MQRARVRWVALGAAALLEARHPAVFLAATHPEGPQVGGGVVRPLLAEGTAEHVTRAMAETAGASPLVTHVEALNNKAGTRVPLARGSKRAG